MVLARRELNNTEIGIKAAYEKGYRVLDEGILLNPKGNPIFPKSFDKYPKFTVHGVNVNKYRCCSIPIHRFAAYCFYGDEMFNEDVCVRHLNDIKTDFSKNNIALGTLSENLHDIPCYLRKQRADYARSFQGPPPNRLFNPNEIHEIRSRLRNGERTVDVAKSYQVSRAVISGIKCGRTYKNII